MIDRNDRISASLIDVASIILSMSLIAIGNGLLYGYIPVRLGADGYAPTWAGAIVTAMSVGGIAGCLLTGHLVRRVGHARAHVVLCALIVLSNCWIGLQVDPMAWVPARAINGFTMCALFIVAQSWLNDAVGDHVRGRVNAIFYVCYMASLGSGYSLLHVIDISSASAPIVGAMFAALSMIPVGLTRLKVPPPAQATSINLALAWRISPVGLLGMATAGGLSMLITGFAPIHATALGYSQNDVATLLVAIPVGTLLLQVPIGWLSDRTDRRYVLLAAALMITAAGLAMLLGGSTLSVLIAVYLVWSGLCDSLYSVSSAQACDRADKNDLVMLTSSLMLAWAVAAAVAPAIGTVLTALYGTGSSMVLIAAIALVYALFVAIRLASKGAAEPSTSFTPMSAHTPRPLEAAPNEEGVS